MRFNVDKDRSFSEFYLKINKYILRESFVMVKVRYSIVFLLQQATIILILFCNSEKGNCKLYRTDIL